MVSENTITTPDGGTLGYRLLRRGNHEVVLILLLHSLGQHQKPWEDFTQKDDELDVLRLDLRGHGRSLSRGHLSHELWVEDIQYLLKTLGYKRAILIGQGLGAQVAIHFSLRFPERCQSLVLIDPVFPESLCSMLALIARCRPVLWLMIRAVWLVNGLGLRRRQFIPQRLLNLDRCRYAAIGDRENKECGLRRIFNIWQELRHQPLANYLQSLYEVTRPVPNMADIDVPVLVLLSNGENELHQQVTRYRVATMDDAEIQCLDASSWLSSIQPSHTKKAIRHWMMQRV